MFKQILVPLDGSALAERAIPHAEFFARVFGANITFLQVLEPAPHPDFQHTVDPLNWQIRKAEANLYLKDISERLQRELNGNEQTGSTENQLQVNYAIREGKTAENIIDFAHTENIDLVVLCTHGSSGLSRWAISSVIQKVINLIYLPVLIVRAHYPPSIEDFKFPYRRILLPIDGSRRAECSLSPAVTLASGISTADSLYVNDNLPDPTRDSYELKTKLWLTAMIKPLEIPILEPFVTELVQLTEQLTRVTKEALGNYLFEMNERLPVESEIRVLENTDTAVAIHEFAEQENIDLVIMCAHGYTGQVTLPYGNVTRNYIEHGNRSVLIIQDIHRSQVRPGAAEVAAELTGRR